MTDIIEDEIIWERDGRPRIEMAVSCRDCDAIPKVPQAGEVIEENGTRLQVMHNGIRVVARGYGGAWTEEVIRRLRGHHEPQEELVFHRIMEWLPERATMIELGAGWSYYSLWFLAGSSDARRSIAVEPDPRVLDVGRHNAALNHRTIEFVQASVGAAPLPPRPFLTETSGELPVPEVSVPSLMQAFGIDRLDLLHCDAQGAEVAVIRSALDLMKSGRIRYAMISTHAHQITGDWLTHQRCLEMLLAAGAKVIAEYEVHESFSGDGGIVVHFPAAGGHSEPVAISRNRYSHALFHNPLLDLVEAEKSLADLRSELAQREAELASVTAARDAGREDVKAAAAKASELSGQVDRWWALADRSLRDLARMRKTWSWRLTKPFRAPARLVRSLRKAFREEKGGKTPYRRFVERLRRSIDKRMRKLRGLPPLPSRIAALPPSGELTDDARLVLWRLNRAAGTGTDGPARR